VGMCTVPGQHALGSWKRHTALCEQESSRRRAERTERGAFFSRAENAIAVPLAVDRSSLT
jgi:hypothetical protein